MLFFLCNKLHSRCAIILLLSECIKMLKSSEAEYSSKKSFTTTTIMTMLTLAEIKKMDENTPTRLCHYNGKERGISLVTRNIIWNLYFTFCCTCFQNDKNERFFKHMCIKNIYRKWSWAGRRRSETRQLELILL